LSCGAAKQAAKIAKTVEQTNVYRVFRIAEVARLEV
jgi:hypothetical protein